MATFQLEDFSTPAFFDSPYALYERIRAEGPLVPLGTDMTMSVDFALCEAMLLDKRLGRALDVVSRRRYGEAAMENPFFRTMGKMFITLNPPQHTRMRALFNHAFKATQVDTMRQVIQATVDRLIDALPADGQFDLMNDFARPLPLNIICQLLGVPVDDGHQLASAIATLAAALDLGPLDAEALDRVNQAVLQLTEYFQAVIDERRRMPPADDLISALLAARDGDARLSDEEIVANVVLLYFAGHETTSNMIGNALLALHRHRDQLDVLKADLSLVPRAIAECMRYDTSVQLIARTALEDADILGCHIPKGTSAFMLLGGANRDPARFLRPATLNILRADSGRPLGFGNGIHFCLGTRLAQTEMEIALRTLLERMPDLVLENVDQPRWRQRGNLRGLEALPAIAASR